MANEDELRLRERLSKLGAMKLLRGTKLSGELARLQDQLDHLRADPSAEEIWQSVELARHADRPYTLDYVERIFEDFFELHGDRGRADDPALVTGLGKLGGRTVVLVGHQKGRDLKERTKRNFGMAYPEGYRKAMRAMALADRHGFPLVTMVDTPGAYPGVAAEQHGQGGAIARSQAAMVRLRVPTVACVIGEGGSGGRRRDRRGRPRADAGERDLLGHLAGGLRGDPLARRGRGAEGGRRVQAGRRALPRARRRSTASSRSRKAARTPMPTLPRSCSSRAFSLHSTRSRGSIPTSGAASGARSTASWAFSPPV